MKKFITLDLQVSDEPTKVKPVWCMVGNIVRERPYGKGGKETRIGTKHFAPGAKVYCFPPVWGDGYKKIKVIGYHKGTKGRQLVVMVINSAWVENRRAELVYSPAIISRFDGAWDGSRSSEKLARSLAGHPEAVNGSIISRVLIIIFVVAMVIIWPGNFGLLTKLLLTAGSFFLLQFLRRLLPGYPPRNQ